jgi:phage terminase large subunit
MWFDADGCESGLEALGWYHEKRDLERDIGLGPEHDWASHGADSAGLMAIVFEAMGAEKPSAQPIKYKQSRYIA